MSAARLLVGDVFERMAELPNGSIDLVLTSPPFLALRAYLPEDHPDKGKEIGTEDTPAEFLDTLLRLTARWRELLAPHGSIVVELGDTYAGSGSPGGDYNEGGIRAGQPRTSYSSRRARTPRGVPSRERVGVKSASADRAGRGDGLGGHHLGGDGWPMDKSLVGIPFLYPLSLAYGMNLLTGAPSPAGRWRVRNVVAWCKPNPSVGALSDKFRPATSFLTIATIARDRYFDLDDVRTKTGPGGNATRRSALNRGNAGHHTAADTELRVLDNPNGAPPLDWWEIPTHSYKGSHYATWTPELLDRPIRTMVPRRVCLTCGEPSRRIVKTKSTGQNIAKPGGPDSGKQRGAVSSTEVPDYAERETIGWTDCGHDSWRNGIVLDPFAGSGTTLAVATGHGRDAVGIDLDERNVDLAEQRVGMFLDVDYRTQEASA